METKKCKQCQVEKSLTAFEYRPDEDAYRPTCKDCRNAAQREKRREARDRRFQGVEVNEAGVLPSIPEGFHVKGVSTLTDEDGNVKGQWVKAFQSAEAREEKLLEAIRELAAEWPKREDNPPEPSNLNSDLLAVYPMGDPHIGMFSWALETGADFDLKIAEQDLYEAVDKLVALAPPAEQALIVNLGDFYHGDNNENRTARSGHALDIDSRWSKVLAVGIRAMRRCIDRALEKHARVRVINEIGNHDDHSSVMLGLALDLLYEGNPRVEIDTSPSTFHWYHFGKTLFGVTHGHGPKLNQLPGIMATDQKELWGQTDYHHWYTGHVHHDQVLTLKEYPSCIIETFRTLAPKDAWHAWRGYRSGQDMKCDIYHRLYGRIVRHTVGIPQIHAERKKK